MEHKELTFTAIYEPSEEGGYIAYIKELPGVNTQGETLDEAKANLREAFQLMYEDVTEESQQRLKGKEFIQEEFKFAI